MNGVTGSTFLWSFIIDVWLLISFLISFKVSFSQAFLDSDGNLVISAKFLVSVIKWDTYEFDSHKEII